MKTTLIKLPQDKFILVSDEAPKYGEWCKSVRYDSPQKFGSFENSYENECKKIIAGIPELPSIDFSLLSEADCKTIGWVDVEKEIKNFIEHRRDFLIIGLDPIDKFSFGMRKGFELGKTAQSLNDKRFSLEDMRFNLILAQKTVLLDLRYEEREHEFTVDEIIQSLQQTSWEVEVETWTMNEGYIDKDDFPYQECKIPKITNNSIKITKIL